MKDEKVVSKPMEMTFDDGTGPIVDACEKQKEEIAKATEKEFKARAKAMEEVNDAKEQKAEFKDGSGKALKIKNMTEKLVLDESEDDMLNESLMDGEPGASFVSDVYNALTDVAFKYEGDFGDMSKEDYTAIFEEAFEWFIIHFFEDEYIGESLKEDYYDDYQLLVHNLYNALYGVLKKTQLDEFTIKDLSNAVDEAEYHLGDVIDEDEQGYAFISEDLDEALPKDLANAYKNKPFRIGQGNLGVGYGNISKLNKSQLGTQLANSPEPRVQYDFQNSNYEEITPEEAMKLKKNGEVDKLRIVFDKQLVAFTPEGKPMFKASRNWRSAINLYDKNGNEVDHTTLLPFKEILARATKIYKADEKPADTALQDKRAKNPESIHNDHEKSTSWNPHAWGSSDDYNYKGDYYRGRVARPYEINAADHSKRLAANYREESAECERKAAEIENTLETDTSLSKKDREELELRIKQYKRMAEVNIERAKSYEKDYRVHKNNIKDFQASLRYMPSKRSLEGVVKEFFELRDDLTSTQNSLDRAKSDYTDIKRNGSVDVRSYRNKLDTAQQQLKDIRLQIAKLELYLESADDDNEKEVNKAAARVDELTNSLDSIKAKINELKTHKKEDLDAPAGDEQLEEAKVTSEFSSYEPWSGAVDTYETIKSAGKLGDLEALIDELYPEGIDETQLNDILWFEDDWLYETLGISEGEDNE